MMNLFYSWQGLLIALSYQQIIDVQHHFCSKNDSFWVLSEKVNPQVVTLRQEPYSEKSWGPNNQDENLGKDLSGLPWPKARFGLKNTPKKVIKRIFLNI